MMMLNDPHEAGYKPHGRGAAEGGGAGELNGSARDAASLGGGSVTCECNGEENDDAE